MKIFNTNITFDKSKVINTIDHHVQHDRLGYICVIDANVISLVNTFDKYKDIVDNSILNICDGSSISMFASFFYLKKLRTFTGPEIFKYYIEKPYKHLLLGNTEEISNEIILKLNASQAYHNNIHFISLPFLDYTGFDYKNIASQINTLQPDFIWVSLGAPKQEYFIFELSKYIEKGVLFGIGAAFNFYTNHYKLSRNQLFGLKFTWFFRLIKEPKKQFGRVSRYIFLLPKLLFNQFFSQLF